jgi:glycerol-3-phosphate dehydrogenase
LERKFLVEELSKYVSIAPYKINNDILGSFSGERPLVKGTGENTSNLLRTHEVEIAESGLVSVLGGKWTTFRAMGEEAIDKVTEKFGFQNTQKSATRNLVMLRNKENSEFDQKLTMFSCLNEETSKYLLKHYGSHAHIVSDLGDKKLMNNLPFIEGEVRYAVKYEYALHPIDVVARRIRLALVNYKSCKYVLKKVTRIMAEELNWTEAKKQIEYEKSLELLKVFISDPN